MTDLRAELSKITDVKASDRNLKSQFAVLDLIEMLEKQTGWYMFLTSKGHPLGLPLTSKGDRVGVLADAHSLMEFVNQATENRCLTTFKFTDGTKILVEAFVKAHDYEKEIPAVTAVAKAKPSKKV